MARDVSKILRLWSFVTCEATFLIATCVFAMRARAAQRCSLLHSIHVMGHYMIVCMMNYSDTRPDQMRHMYNRTLILPFTS